MGQRYLITGGAGFIGSHLAEYLLQEGHSVSIIDDLSTGQMDNIRHLKVSSEFEYVIDSLDNKSLVAELVDSADNIVHLAAAVGVRLIVESPVRTIETNVRGTEIVLEAANKKNKPTLIASTSEVYGKSTVMPFNEEHDLVIGATTRGRWSYACSKALDEFLAIAFWNERSLPVVVARFFNTVGPRQTARYGMVIPNFVRQALAGDPITVFGDGTQSRCFAHVRDVVHAIPALLSETEAFGQVFNVGNTEEVSIMALAERIRERTGSSSEITLIPYEDAYKEGFEDMPRRVPDIAKVERVVGWKPKHNLDAILDDVIAYERTHSNP